MAPGTGVSTGDTVDSGNCANVFSSPSLFATTMTPATTAITMVTNRKNFGCTRRFATGLDLLLLYEIWMPKIFLSLLPMTIILP